LEDHRDVALARSIVLSRSSDVERCRTSVLDAGDQAQQRRLAAADGPTRTMNSPSWISSVTSSTARGPCRQGLVSSVREMAPTVLTSSS